MCKCFCFNRQVIEREIINPYKNLSEKKTPFMCKLVLANTASRTCLIQIIRLLMSNEPDLKL